MTNEKTEVSKATVEYIDPTKFKEHPLKMELQLSLADRPQKAKDAMDNAWNIIPDQVVPVFYTPIIIDGVEHPALLDGSGRVSKAIQNKVPLIAAIRVETEGLEVKEIFKKILAPGHSFHLSLLETGKAATRLHKEIAFGQGKRTDISGGAPIDPDDEIAGMLGYGLNSSRVKKARLVYQKDPNLLRMVDAGELKSLHAAYMTIKTPHSKTMDSYTDGDEVEIAGNTIEEVSAEMDLVAKDGAAHEIHPVIEIAQSEEEESTSIENTSPVPEVIINLQEGKESFVLRCPCCDNKVKVIIVK